MKVHVEFAHEGQVARVILAAPKANIVDQAMMAELESASTGSRLGETSRPSCHWRRPQFQFWGQCSGASPRADFWDAHPASCPAAANC